MAAARKKAVDQKAKRQAAAQAFLLGKVLPGESLVGWLQDQVGDVDDDSPRGQAQVRDGEDTIEALVVQRGADGIRVLSWVDEKHGGRLIETDGASPPHSGVARVVAGCTIRLPPALSRGATADEVVESLERTFYPSWQHSPWLAGQLVLQLDESLSANIAGHRLVYDRDRGLIITEMS